MGLKRCDGKRRRDFLQVGALTALGLSLEQALAMEAQDPGRKEVSCILIWLDGGPSHLDMFDPKPEAPVEIRGDFRAIETSVSGLRICEHLPRTAQVMRQATLIRSLTHELGNHDTGSHLLLTGHRPSPTQSYPSLGSVAARESGLGSALPPYVAIPNPVAALGPGYLPADCAPFSVGGDPSRADYTVRDLLPPPGQGLERVERRRHYLQELEKRDGRGATVSTAARSRFFERALRLISSDSARKAFRVEQEPISVRDRYGRGRIGTSCLLARRLVEGGSRFVSVVDTGWDTHQDISRELPDSRFPGSGKLPSLDRAYAALITDLKDRGLLATTLVLLMGEFGRTPKLNGRGGRDHWPRAGFAVASGAGVRAGGVIGATDASGESPSEQPVRPEDLAWSVLTILGIDPRREYRTPDGRPLRLLGAGGMIPGLMG